MRNPQITITMLASFKNVAPTYQRLSNENLFITDNMKLFNLTDDSYLVVKSKNISYFEIAPVSY